MCTCLHICPYGSLHTCTHVHVYPSCTYLHSHVYTHTSIHERGNPCTHVHIGHCTHVPMGPCKPIHSCTYLHTHANAPTRHCPDSHTCAVHALARTYTLVCTLAAPVCSCTRLNTHAHVCADLHMLAHMLTHTCTHWHTLTPLPTLTSPCTHEAARRGSQASPHLAAALGLIN